MWIDVSLVETQEQRRLTYLFPGEFLAILFIILSHVDQSLTAEGRDGHSALFRDFPVAVSVGVNFASWRSNFADFGLLRVSGSVSSETL